MPVNLLGTAGVRIRVAAKQIKTIPIDVEHPQVAARTSYMFLSSSFSSKLATYPFINDVCDAWSILLRPFFFYLCTFYSYAFGLKMRTWSFKVDFSKQDTYSLGVA